MVRLAAAEVEAGDGSGLILLQIGDLIALVVQALPAGIQAQGGIGVVRGAASEGKARAASVVQRHVAFQRHRGGAGAHVRQRVAAALGGEADAPLADLHRALSGDGAEIRFGREVSDDSMEDAIDSAQASEFINQLEERTEHELTTNGTNVSGGQRQRILLSRAFASNPEFLLLDDSSSALDYATDAKLRRALTEKYPDTTMVIIAQRVSSIRSCDQIMILDNGDLSDIGTDEELTERSALYASICDSQMGGALFE